MHVLRTRTCHGGLRLMFRTYPDRDAILSVLRGTEQPAREWGSDGSRLPRLRRKQMHKYAPRRCYWFSRNV